MIFGVMPKFQQRLHAWGFCGFMCLLFTGLTFLGTAVFVAGLTGAGPNPVAYVLFGGFFAAFAVWAIVSQVRGLHTLVREFSYDGRWLRFRTIVSSQEQARELPDVVEVREGRSHRGSMGHCVAFRDGKRVYLDGWLQNGWILADQLRFDLRRLQGLSPEPIAAAERPSI